MLVKAATPEERDLCTHTVQFVMARESYDEDYAEVCAFLSVDHREGFYDFVVEPNWVAGVGTQYEAVISFSHWLTCFEFQLWLDGTGIGF